MRAFPGCEEEGWEAGSSPWWQHTHGPAAACCSTGRHHTSLVPYHSRSNSVLPGPKTAAEEAGIKTLCFGGKIKFLRPLSCRGGRNAVPGTLEVDGAETLGTPPSETKDTISEEAGPEEPSSILLAPNTLTYIHSLLLHPSQRVRVSNTHHRGRATGERQRQTDTHTHTHTPDRENE